MPRARVILIVAVATAAAAGALVRGQTQRPERPMQVVKVKDNLYVLRGPFNKCAPNGCGAYADDGFLHEAGDVAVRVTPQGLIVVDDKYEENAAAAPQVSPGDRTRVPGLRMTRRQRGAGGVIVAGSQCSSALPLTNRHVSNHEV